jgi:CubicO group peptidase (beta-lactamase class C family)
MRMPSAASIATATDLIARAVADRIFPAAAVEVGDAASVLWRQTFGRLTFDADAPAVTERTVFDLASLAKPIATTTIVMRLLAAHAVELHDKVGAFFEDWRGEDRETVTVQDLFEHASGLPARLVDIAPQTRREFEHDICTIRLEYGPRTRAIYSDLDFILLGFLATDVGQATLATQFEAIARQVTDDVLGFGVPEDRRANTAPTLPLEDDVRRGRVLIGEVHDNYAAALGGVAGHAGLFGTAGSVGAFGRAVLRAARGDASVPPPLTPELVARATRKSDVPGSSRALGWDTMKPTSSCGTEMSPAAFGHVGFTGTSLWIDPPRNRYFVLLTNRVYAGASSDAMQAVRRAFHNALAGM